MINLAVLLPLFIFCLCLSLARCAHSVIFFLYHTICTLHLFSFRWFRAWNGIFRISWIDSFETEVFVFWKDGQTHRKSQASIRNIQRMFNDWHITIVSNNMPCSGVRFRFIEICQSYLMRAIHDTNHIISENIIWLNPIYQVMRSLLSSFSWKLWP